MTLKNEGYIARIKEGVDDEILQKSETAAEKKDWAPQTKAQFLSYLPLLLFYHYLVDFFLCSSQILGLFRKIFSPLNAFLK